ncbi:helix-turn-helix transcriptional regulator [Mycobacteroides abscessus subsp. abscessus]|uniref:helix-turn-helix domain-containing protein n=1 Tax=Mycobacteroides abscessus TaxID=36809 RepID=UPI00265A7BFC|nr:helix-turn-helix transcriptional regulator [Mycobacteroides abscessus]MDO3074767.1 helix-turn-helix transcriptional regulator [Mycobacteroides abscessus subsp. abscessus]MDO3288264.1 helix-turn-helix transcriptional regulator [Mycobacteroides abscessus subsp. abscessus]MDO3296539.1 helix-turn-helix transcriptional regulator [Mycobacteroides abscessus subsp. abscessus]WKE39724.1 helix-turn-helix transcriptional regulator [Mycobacteroides abscessus subsp. abscessus]
MTSPEPLATVIGRNCKRIRNEIGLTQNEFARYARDRGLRWKASTVADFESGRSAPTFGTVLAVSLALELAAQIAERYRWNRDTGGVFPELVNTDGDVQLNDGLTVPARLVVEVCRGKPWEVWATAPDSSPEPLLSLYKDIWGDAALTAAERIMTRSGQPEERLARQLDIEMSRLADISNLLWQRTFSEERDRRAGPEANAQKKGRVARELRRELEEALADGEG